LYGVKLKRYSVTD